MNARTALASAFVLAPLFAGADAPAIRLRFAPDEGERTKKTFETKLDLTLDDLVIDGPASAAPPKMEMTLRSTQTLVVEDEYAKLREGAPAVLLRTYDQIEAEMSVAGTMEILGESRTTEQSMRAETELEGKRVRFAWNAEKDSYESRFDPELDKPMLLEGLVEDLDLRALLPRGEVEIGDEWTIAARDLANVLAPGGNLSLVPETTDERSLKLSSEMGSVSQMLSGGFEGEARARLEGVREEDGTQLAVVRLDLKVKSKSDLTEVARKALEETDLPAEVEALELEKLEVEYTFEGEGELVWDLRANRFRSLSISGDADVESEERMSVTFGGKTVKIGQRRSLSGTSSVSAKAE